jgi:hypothetical protein
MWLRRLKFEPSKSNTREGYGTKMTEHCFSEISQWRLAQMADDKSKQDNRDRSKVSSSEEYEVQYLMTKYDLSRNRALELIIKHNRSRKEIERELEAVDI